MPAVPTTRSHLHTSAHLLLHYPRVIRVRPILSLPSHQALVLSSESSTELRYPLRLFHPRRSFSATYFVVGASSTVKSLSLKLLLTSSSGGAVLVTYPTHPDLLRAGLRLHPTLLIRAANIPRSLRLNISGSASELLLPSWPDTGKTRPALLLRTLDHASWRAATPLPDRQTDRGPEIRNLVCAGTVSTL